MAYALLPAEGCTPVKEENRSLGIFEATFYIWKKKYGELAQRSQDSAPAQEENSRLKRIVSDLTLNMNILQEVLRKKIRSRHAAVTLFKDHRYVQGER